jgi:hypothetical protein
MIARRSQLTQPDPECSLPCRAAGPQEAAQELALAPSTQGKLSKLSGLLRALDSGPVAAWLARALICSYFLNQAYEGWETWGRMQSLSMRTGLRRWALCGAGAWTGPGGGDWRGGGGLEGEGCMRGRRAAAGWLGVHSQGEQLLAAGGAEVLQPMHMQTGGPRKRCMLMLPVAASSCASYWQPCSRKISHICVPCACPPSPPHNPQPWPPAGGQTTRCQPRRTSPTGWCAASCPPRC